MIKLTIAEINLSDNYSDKVYVLTAWKQMNKCPTYSGRVK